MNKSYCITVRPKNGLSVETQTELVKWFCKQDGYHAVIEMENEARHLHGQIWIEAGRNRGEIVRSVKRICERTIEDWNAAQAKVLSGGVKIAYSDWYESYLENAEKKSGDKVNVICEKVPDKTEDFYASEEEQLKLKDSCNATDKRFHKLSVDFKDWYEKQDDKDKSYRVEIEDVGYFVGESMFKMKSIPVIADTRCCKQLVKALHQYITERVDITSFLTKEQYDMMIYRYEQRKLENDQMTMTENTK